MYVDKVKDQQCLCLTAVAVKQTQTREVKGIKDEYTACCHADKQLMVGIVQCRNVAIWVEEGVWSKMKGLMLTIGQQIYYGGVFRGCDGGVLCVIEECCV